MLDWSQLAGLRAAGIEIGGHSHTHPHLDTLAPRAAREEIAGCKALLEQSLGEPVRSFAYPHGYSSRRVRRLVAAGRLRQRVRRQEHAELRRGRPLRALAADGAVVDRARRDRTLARPPRRCPARSARPCARGRGGRTAGAERS